MLFCYEFEVGLSSEAVDLSALINNMSVTLLPVVRLFWRPSRQNNLESPYILVFAASKGGTDHLS